MIQYTWKDWWIQAFLLQLEFWSTPLWIHAHLHGHQKRHRNGFSKNESIWCPVSMEMSISQHKSKKKKGITRQIQNSEGRRHQLIPEQQVQLLPVEQWVLSKSHEVYLTAATWLHWGKEDLQPHKDTGLRIITKDYFWSFQTHLTEFVHYYGSASSV